MIETDYERGYQQALEDINTPMEVICESWRSAVEQADFAFRVIIAGGRDFHDYALLKQTMDRLLSNIENNIVIVCGMARGADRMGERYAKERGLAIDYYPANWDLHGKRAGYIRNEQMVQNADALVAFWDGQSRGTKHMINTAKQYGLKIRVIRYKKEDELY